MASKGTASVVRGKDGTNGRDGKDGLPGKDGTNGAPGKDGLNGTNGANGAPGKDGVNGAPGKDGANGKDGVNGTNGTNGTNGATLLGTITLAETATVAISAGTRRLTLTVPTAWGVVVGQNLLAFPVSVPSLAYATHDVIVTGPNTISVGLTTPLIALLASYSITCRLVRINA
jgi:hypothetical protein